MARPHWHRSPSWQKVDGDFLSTWTSKPVRTRQVGAGDWKSLSWFTIQNGSRERRIEKEKLKCPFAVFYTLRRGRERYEKVKKDRQRYDWVAYTVRQSSMLISRKQHSITSLHVYHQPRSWRISYTVCLAVRTTDLLPVNHDAVIR